MPDYPRLRAAAGVVDGSATYGRVAQPLTVSYIGDSEVPSAASYSYGTAVHWASVARALLGHRYTEGVIAGIGGQTSDQIAARIATVTAGGQSICLIDGGTNDLAAGMASSAITPNLQTMITACKAAGIIPVVLTALPSVNVNTAAKLLEQHRLNTWIRALPATQGVLSVDWGTAVVDWASTTGAWLAAYTADSIHANEAGHVRLGNVIAQALAPLVSGQPSPLLSSAGANSGLISLNPGMNGSGGTAGTGVTGTVPASWTVQPISTGTVACTVEARVDGVSGNWLKCDWSAGDFRLFYQNTAAGVDWSIGDTVWLEAEVLITATPTNMRSMWAQLDFWNGIGSVSDASFQLPPSTLLPILGSTTPLVLRTKPTVIPASTGRLQMFVNFLNFGTPSGTIRIGRTAIRKSV